jgi:hypothetical protein
MIESGPIPAAHGVVRWRLIDLAQWIYEEFRITIAKQTLSRELRDGCPTAAGTLVDLTPNDAKITSRSRFAGAFEFSPTVNPFK